ncbi:MULTISPECIES: sugar kinase [unclassified Enterococcus]|uniref:sugar kinase n=1 Tax=unclassified Enterococcus TaxID=2608891 RepID=UPI0015525F85|nr:MULTISPECIES: sugar kinase [unclassified Enterococcus]MBS7577666.1 sugar kinase [Enterococcus sp. MMGLQ5-2]MBS7584140.1 sugar kinase [Enterococcus sp. MMGLQ5-1]NPD11998.1 sugar kinase [Enterococcus sp. MMGLQ5-1]NPD37499.1 sugar kinase [Enterococcus sp. MMGLQ5-2]
MSEFITLGEPLAVFASQDCDVPLSEAIHFQKFLAGAELNVAIGVARLGHTTQYISQVGEDAFGQFILNEINQHGVGSDYIETTATNPTGFYFKEKVSTGDPKVEYYRKGSAAAHLNSDYLKNVNLSQVKIAHLSGIMAAISEFGLKAVDELFDLLNQQGIQTTFDPNLRPALWSSEDVMVKTLNELAKKAVIVLPGVNEGKILVGTDDLEAIADFYLDQSTITQTVIVKNGSKGALVKVRGEQPYAVSAFKVERVVDTVGAGDGFAVGLISGLLEKLPLKSAVERACAIGARAVQYPGDNDGYPTPSELVEFLKTNEGV